ncbi:hypothetical protein LPN01_11945 [Sphingomonas sp. A2-49]|uniref:hypothetical protein n=1 Tax=Sphingomonas sp. A2-49 TaxID=1391375 RepID=UPI0021D05AFF|nr:hypothetical protein [Sphingomonas sp. A2-49]MCU6454789.1 hypothetical protein [Sphingomonas sp. A2-49]
MAKLKVYRTPIGFHDAYVAATSQKAALAAWGSTHDLFARGVAEVVDDPALTAAPLASPGTVVKRSRGTAAEQIAALPAARPTRRAAPHDAAEPDAPAPAPVRKARAPRPDRSRLDAAEEAVTQAAARASSAQRALRAEETALAKRRRTMEREQEDERERLDAARQAAADAYDGAMRRWRG